MQRELNEQAFRDFRVTGAIGHYVHPELFVKDSQATVATAGGNLIQVDVKPNLYQILLSQRPALRNAKRIDNAVGNQTINVASSGQTVSWVVENTTSVDSNTAQITSFTLNPATAIATVGMSKQLIKQSQTSEDNFVLDFLTEPVSNALENAIWNGLGSSQNQPAALLTYAVNPQGQNNYRKLAYNGVTFGGSPSWQKATNLLTAVENSNIATESISFVTSPNSKNILINTPIVSGYPRMIWCDDNTIAGRPALVITALSSGQLVCCDLSRLLVVFWGMFIAPDPYTLAQQLITNFNITLLVNAAPLYANAFTVSADAV